MLPRASISLPGTDVVRTASERAALIPAAGKGSRRKVEGRRQGRGSPCTNSVIRTRNIRKANSWVSPLRPTDSEIRRAGLPRKKKWEELCDLCLNEPSRSFRGMPQFERDLGGLTTILKICFDYRKWGPDENPVNEKEKRPSKPTALDLGCTAITGSF